MSKVNIIARGAPGREYILTDLIATRLDAKTYAKLQAINQETLGEYRYIPYEETDFSSWPRISRKLTRTKITGARFSCDFYGNITEEDY